MVIYRAMKILLTFHYYDTKLSYVRAVTMELTTRQSYIPHIFHSEKLFVEVNELPIH